MRLVVMTVAAIAAINAAGAQTTSADGRARLVSGVGPYFTPEGATQPATKEHMRTAMVALMADGKISPPEKDFLTEVATQQPFTMSIDGLPREWSIPAAGLDAVALAGLLLAPPNMHTLWHADPAKTEQLIEISRWGQAAHARVTAFFGNQLYDAWGQSNILNAFSPFVDVLGLQWNAVKALSNPASVRAGKELLIAGCAFTKQKVASEGKVPPQDFLCAWMPGSL